MPLKSCIELYLRNSNFDILWNRFDVIFVVFYSQFLNGRTWRRPHRKISQTIGTIKFDFGVVCVWCSIDVSDKFGKNPTRNNQNSRGSKNMHSSSSSSMSSPSTSSNVSASRSLFTIFGRAENVHRKLLYELMSTVHEYLVRIVVHSEAERNAAPVVDQRRFAAEETLFIRIHRCVEQILVNGLRIFKPDVSTVRYVKKHLTFTHNFDNYVFSRTSFTRSHFIVIFSCSNWKCNWCQKLNETWMITTKELTYVGRISI